MAVFATSYPPAFLGGGPVRTLEALVEASPPTLHLFVLAPNKDLDGSYLKVDSGKWICGQGHDILYAPVHTAIGLCTSYWRLRAKGPTVVYLNSFFNLRASILPQFLARVGFWKGARLLLAPRGEFGQAALGAKHFKKSIYLFLYRLFRMDTAVTWHASNEIEAVNIRRLWGDSARVLVREDETSLPVLSSEPRRNDGPMRAVFLGRLVPHKGLLTVIEALESSSAALTVNVYGPEEDELYARQCKAAANRCPSSIKFTFHGPIPPERSREVLDQHDVMLMPTRGENFGHVIAESLSVSCPVICSAETQWTDILIAGGGAIVPSNRTDDWKVAIEAVALASPESRFVLRLQAGAAYDRWRSESKGAHVLSVMIDSSRL